MSRSPFLIASLLLQLACAGRVAPSMDLSVEPRGTDVTLLPAYVSSLSEPGAVVVKLERPAYVTIYEQVAEGDSLRRVYATPEDSSHGLDGSVKLGVTAAVRHLPGARRQEVFTREQCTNVPMGAGQPSVSMCSADTPITRSVSTASTSVRWRFARPLLLIATEQPYAAPAIIPITWFRTLDVGPPNVTGAWAAVPFNVTVPVGTRFRATSVGRR
jgi:hypothetical protein